MAPPTYDPIPLSDSSFLAFETATTHMHLGGVAIFDAGPLLTTPAGGIDIARIRAHLASRLHLIPRYRQRLAWVPLQRRPVWVDDQHFNLPYHVRHTSLPRPGDDRQLKRLTGRIMSQRLDRGKPLWEAWIVEGLEGGRFALINKTHHCMADGVSAVGLLQVLLSPSPDETPEDAPRWHPRPTPTPLELLRDELLRQAQQPFELARQLAGVLRRPEALRAQVAEHVTGVWHLLRAGLQGAADTPLNQPVGPHRRFDYLALDFGEVRAIRQRLGGTVNDVVLATVAGAVGRFLKYHGISVRGLDYRAVVPVSVRKPEELGEMSNRASGWLTSLPIQERDPRRRLARVRSLTGQLKASKQALGPLALLKLAEWASPVLVTLGIRLTAWLQPYNLIVTNVPGPPIPLYMLGAPLLEGYPLVPLFDNQGLGVATFSYGGKLCIGVNADRELVPDVHQFVTALAASFAELREAAALEAPAQDAAPSAGAGQARASG